MKGERHGQLNESEMLETARQALLEKAVLHAGFVHNKLGCSHTVKVNACPPTRVSCSLWEALRSTSGLRCWMAPWSYVTCLLSLMALKWCVKIFLVWWFLNLFWALTRPLHTYHPLKPRETLRGPTSPCTLRKNVQRSWQWAVFGFTSPPPTTSYFWAAWTVAAAGFELSFPFQRCSVEGEQLKQPLMQILW